jgi:hypothetical protein
MPRDKASGRNERLRIADIAARLITEDGIADFATAKRKAARQIGATETRNLPTNDEVETALKTYQQLYQAGEHEQRLEHLRGCALDMMRELERFNPQLSGAVLDGSAGRYSDIDLHLFTDSAKDVELYLLNNAHDYRAGQRRVYRGGVQDTIPVLVVTTDEAEFNLSIFASIDLRLSLRSTRQGRPFRHAGLKTLSAIQSQDNRYGGELDNAPERAG